MLSCVKSVRDAGTSTHPQWLRHLLSSIPYVGMFLLTFLLWLPFSFKTTGLVEEWMATGILDSGHNLFFITPDSPFGDHRMRPFEVIFHAAAYALDPNSFLFYNVFQMVLLFGKMAAAYWLVLQFLPKQRLLAFITGTLFLLYPVDTAIFTFRAIHIHGAILTYLLAVNLLIQFIKRPGRRGLAALLGAAILLMFSLMAYQIALPIALLTPLTLFYFARLPDRRLWIAAGVWYAAITLPVLYAVWALHQTAVSSYEMDLLHAKATDSSSELRGMIDAVVLAYKRQVVGWGAAWHKLYLYPQLRLAAVAGMALFMGIGAWLRHMDRRDPAGTTVSRRRYLAILAVAVMLVPIGMAIYLPVATHRLQDFRIYLLSTLGSAFVLALALFWISRRMPRYRAGVLLGLALPFVGLGFVCALQQHQYYVNYSLVQQQVLQDTLAQAPRLKPSSFVVYVDRSGCIEDEYVFHYGYYLGTALKYLYADQSIDAGYCLLGQGEVLRTVCEFGKESIHITRPAGPTSKLDLTIPNERLVILTNDDTNNRLRLMTPAEATAEFGIAGYDPGARISAGSPPLRASTMFSRVPALFFYGEQTAPDSSYDLPATGRMGIGWRAAEQGPSGTTFRWSLKPTATIDVNLADDADLALEFGVLQWLDATVMNSLTLSLNGADIPLTYQSAAPAGRTYRGILPRTVLANPSGRTQLIFRVSRITPVPGSPDEKLGIALSWLRIRPRARR